MPDERQQYLQVVRTYLLARRAWWLLAVMVTIGGIVGVWGSLEAPTPTAAGSAGATVQFWRLLAVGAGSLPVLTLASPLANLEAAGAGPFHRLRSIVLGLAFLLSSASILTATAIGVDGAAMLLIARALPAWFGLALLSGRILGWTHSWILPWATLCVMIYWGHSGNPGQYHWWEFTAQPLHHLPSALLAGSLFAAGLLAYTLSSWRLHRLRHTSDDRLTESDPSKTGPHSIV
ncbi:hypothetical protein QLQ12_07005 [Actinoplanes sp. NEAU-A12]|uniref:ABC transporter permease n=1 Tax=Actinoplanes sandaracinus TaxID=3045177 RepID=A0ABT6WF48_9ACTN|nr:hypothetical protein [Actinoplanes sandaracinus]MDI6098349.1 hypothetical protein [Actinoplanes sandaracinus]